MLDEHLITREIGIDAGHRVTFHGSKCRNVHGHRYTIRATCAGPLHGHGEQQGMVLDFGFLKEEMMSVIDERCDHGMILWVQDPILPKFLDDDAKVPQLPDLSSAWHTTGPMGKLYVVPFVPTAENLAAHWFYRLAGRVKGRSNGLARLWQIEVQETPNCSASFPLRPT